ncbi:MAG: ATP-binding protein [Gammaproteobacteria bacterium]|nr:ATP-binding protein [Gammaproteobacteria bacterium]
MIRRNLETRLRQLVQYYPVVTITGPRQSGKTTLCKGVFPEKPYVSLEPLDMREYAQRDPRGFLAEYEGGAVIDEIQHTPELLSYLQAEVDVRPESGRYILTGSQHFGLSQAISQSLAGRCGVLALLPLSLDELHRFPAPPVDLFTALWQGGYPRIHDQNIPAGQWLADYIATYVQRDVRQIVNIGDLQTFSGFLKLCAANTGRELNLSSLGGDAGVSHNTARSWLSVLETGYILHRLPAWHRNLRKQVVKAPKLHFFDSGLACHLLGIREPEQLRHHPLRGAIFESWTVSEIYKARIHRGLMPDLFHYRESRGLEVDLVLEQADSLTAVEMKSGATLSMDFLTGLRRFAARLQPTGEKQNIKSYLVYGGNATQRRSDVFILPWSEVPAIDWSIKIMNDDQSVLTPAQSDLGGTRNRV